MTDHIDPLDAVVAELDRRKGELAKIAKECGLSYDTVLRIKNQENDPGYSKVLSLHRHLFGVERGALPQSMLASTAQGAAHG